MYMFERFDTTGQRSAEHRARLLHGGSWQTRPADLPMASGAPHPPGLTSGR